MGYTFTITIKNDEDGTEEDFEAKDYDEATGFIAAHYAKMLKELEQKSADIIDEMADEEEVLQELK